MSRQVKRQKTKTPVAGVGECAACGATLAGLRSDAKYCSARCRKRACEDRSRGQCRSCGAALFAGSKWRGTERCQDCQRQHYAELTAAKHRKMESLWAAGKSWREVGAAFGWSQEQTSVEFFRAREAGANLPYRYAMEDGRRIAA